MSVKKRGLGRGLDALLGGGGAQLEAVALEKMKTVAVERLQPSRFQPRKDIDPAKLQELADSISAQGMVQPVVARTVGEGRYEIIAGERRWRAAQLAGLREVPVVVRDVTDQAAMAIALIENIQRQDLNPLEEAEALKRLLDEYGMTHQQLADAVGKSRAAVTNLLRLNELHPEAKQLLLAGSLEMGHARALLGLDTALQADIAQQVAAKQLSVRATEALVQQAKAGIKPAPKPPVPKDPDIRQLEENIAMNIGAPVSIRHGKQGAGRLIIQYDSLDQLEGVLERLR
ncbi:ParB/RepB/Spo0J family partition protein [Methylomagnum ishizawai]|uniref:ParB/RepB/Spo0J family partition protein n=1 Tax=Methylomagnum ishizawai TaxID=1760988 RepID=UPI001C33B1D5|nr:ParB/RepB/Spo0J family partition protein [Methylomagnum ishizawai]BBL72956.1 chromosome partitioning protein [Methylomagnum ishizawai]